ncbi:MAG: asparagine synthase (glutamine-hydrolyzing) [Candidatus Hydrogenedentota bacterium]
MCGICGIYYFDKHNNVKPEQIITMRDTMIHRGPDDCGLYLKGNIGLGHRRLSVIDLETGHQPIFNEDRTIVIIFNGEIYNYLELKERYLKHHTFTTKTDTEVIIHLYEEFGTGAFCLLEGMFAFALYDASQDVMRIVRDYFGIKPLYYYYDKDQFIFASEIKALLKLGIEPVLNDEIMLEYLTFQYYQSDSTLLENINRLTPGCYLSLSWGLIKKDRYWQLKVNEDQSITETDAREHIKKLIQNSVKLQLRSDVPLGCHLSGGVDTAIISGIVSKQNIKDRLKTFTAYFSNESGIYDDTFFAEKTARHIGAEMFKIDLNEDDFFETLRELFYYLEEPGAGEGALPHYFVSKLASENVKVVLGGQGADEMFGGYVRYYILYHSLLSDSSVKLSENDLRMEDLKGSAEQLKNYNQLYMDMLTSTCGCHLAQKYFFLINRLKEPGKVLSEQLYNKYKSYDTRFAIRPFLECNAESTILNRVLLYEINTWLPTLLNVEDRMSMRWSVESRVPFLSHQLAEFAMQIPAKIKLNGGILKYILKQSMKNYLHPEIFKRKDKIGFPVPLTCWHKRITEYLRNMIKNSPAIEYIFSRQYLNTAATETKEFDRGLWGLISVSNWLNIFQPKLRDQ